MTFYRLTANDLIDVWILCLPVAVSYCYCFILIYRLLKGYCWVRCFHGYLILINEALPYIRQRLQNGQKVHMKIKLIGIKVLICEYEATRLFLSSTDLCLTSERMEIACG